MAEDEENSTMLSNAVPPLLSILALKVYCCRSSRTACGIQNNRGRT